MPAQNPPVPEWIQRLSFLRWVMGAGFLIWGLATVDTQSLKWAVAGVGLFSLPLIAQILPYSLPRHLTAWTAFLICLQTLYGYYFPSYYHFNPKNGVWDVPLKDRSIVRVTFDEEGYRTTTKINYRKKSAPRIFFIGASTTAMTDVTNEAMWSNRVGELLEHEQNWKVETINTAISGTRLIHQLATLRHISRFSPDAVVFLIGVNDWSRDIKSHFLQKTRAMEFWNFEFRENDRFALKYSPLARLLAPRKEEAVVNPAATSEVASDESRKMLTLRAAKLRTETRSWKPASVSNEFNRNLKQLAAECHQMQVPCLVMDQPSGYKPDVSKELEDAFWMNPPPEADYRLDLASMIHIAKLYNTRIEAFTMENGLKFCRLSDKLPPTTEYFRDEVHFTLKGNNRIAELVHDCLLPLLSSNPAFNVSNQSNSKRSL